MTPSGAWAAARPIGREGPLRVDLTPCPLPQRAAAFGALEPSGAVGPERVLLPFSDLRPEAPISGRIRDNIFYRECRCDGRTGWPVKAQTAKFARAPITGARLMKRRRWRSPPR